MQQPACRHSAPASLEDAIETFGDGLVADFFATGDDEGLDVLGDLSSLEDGGGGAKVFDAAVGAGADEDDVDGDIAGWGCRG